MPPILNLLSSFYYEASVNYDTTKLKLGLTMWQSIMHFRELSKILSFPPTHPGFQKGEFPFSKNFPHPGHRRNKHGFVWL